MFQLILLLILIAAAFAAAPTAQPAPPPPIPQPRPLPEEPIQDPIYAAMRQIGDLRREDPGQALLARIRRMGIAPGQGRRADLGM